MMTQISVISESLKDIACSPFCGALLANEIENEIESGEYRAERNADDKATDYHDDNRCFHPLRHQAEVFESRHLNARGIRGAWLISAVLCLCSNLHALRVKATRIFLDSSLRLRCVAVGRFGPRPGFVTLRQTFVHCCQCGIVRKQGEPTGRMALLDGRDEQ